MDFTLQIDFEDYSDDEEEDEDDCEDSEDESDDEKASEGEEPTTRPEWIRQRSSDIVALARKNMNLTHATKTYLSPMEILQRTKEDTATPSTDAPEEPSEASSVSFPFVRHERYREVCKL